LEQLLAERYAVFLADTALIFSPTWKAHFAETIKQVQYAFPT
jgi:hypothetical protein